MQGEMVITVTFGGDPISKSPFAVGVAAPLDLSKIQVDGLESRKYSFIYVMGLLYRFYCLFYYCGQHCYFIECI